ncbi:MAG: hypothetical protein MZW92_26670 [Comamonadaceae bacterium]|nr:hypothetical protein [Comamonadaceae bacterium]
MPSVPEIDHVPLPGATAGAAPVADRRNAGAGGGRAAGGRLVGLALEAAGCAAPVGARCLVVNPRW